MCNLSYSILEKGIEQGKTNLIKDCLRDGKTCEEIATFLKLPLQSIQAIEEELYAIET